jgi:hypothetical protein
VDVFVESNQASKCSMKSSVTPEHTVISWNFLLTWWNLYVTHLRKVRQFTFVRNTNVMSTNSDAIHPSSLMVAYMTECILTVGWLLLLLWTHLRSPTRSTNLLCNPPPKKHTNMSPQLLRDWEWSPDYLLVSGNTVIGPCFVISISHDSSKVVEAKPCEEWADKIT